MTSVRSVLQRLFLAAGAGDVEAVLELWGEDGVLEDVTLDQVLTGKPEVARYLREFFMALPDLSYTPEEIWTVEDRGIVAWRGTAHPTGSFFGITVAPKALSLRGVDLFWVRDERVIRERSWYGDGRLFERMAGRRAAGSGEHT